ncbi:hypothetical protein GMORB2_0938 [Geosmithia morbida]|uniref:Uncharacterized protein n=1 Tax=Geosmithia morbida TaxID=1094350 RepID=A0A9P4Z1H4_9HYPO|nr:uncharacterized protein GMORB2_0938 [Geosmithia morbida]KAF4125694.1 hypothetical protein GMORB2_0938 [Geosmithia morbida]
MISFAPTPVFSGTWYHHRPSVPSPLSSSPVRASSPLSPSENNTLSMSQRHTQSSPIQPSSKSKYASRPTRPNPVVRKREDAQDMRRRNFLQSVRQKSEEKQWLRRDIEGQLLKASYLDTMDLLSHGAPELSDADIEDAMALEAQFQQQLRQRHNGNLAAATAAGDDMAMYDDELPPDEDEEMDALVASYQEQVAVPTQRPESPSTMTDDDYDDIFAELIAQERQRLPSTSEDVQMDTAE